MRSDWILDVLTDLKTFANANDLPVLAEQLDDTAIVALAEIAAMHERTQNEPNAEEHDGGGSLSDTGASGHA